MWITRFGVNGSIFCLAGARRAILIIGSVLQIYGNLNRFISIFCFVLLFEIIFILFLEGIPRQSLRSWMTARKTFADTFSNRETMATTALFARCVFHPNSDSNDILLDTSH